MIRAVLELLLDLQIGREKTGSNLWDDLLSSSFRDKSCFVNKSAYANQAFALVPNFNLDAIVNARRIRVEAALDEVQLVQAEPLHLLHLMNQTESSKYYLSSVED